MGANRGKVENPVAMNRVERKTLSKAAKTDTRVNQKIALGSVESIEFPENGRKGGEKRGRGTGKERTGLNGEGSLRSGASPQDLPS